MTTLMSFLPVRLDLPILQGSTFYRKFNWIDDNIPVNIEDCTFRMQIRQNHESRRVLADLSTENGNFEIIQPINGEFYLYISPEDTEKYRFDEAVYDIEAVFENGEVYRICEGFVKLYPEVTR